MAAFQLSSNHPAVAQTGLEPCRHRSNPSDPSLLPHVTKFLHFNSLQTMISEQNTCSCENSSIFKVHQVCYGYMLSVLLPVPLCLKTAGSVVCCQLLSVSLVVPICDSWLQYVPLPPSLCVSTHSLSFPTTLFSIPLPTALIRSCPLCRFLTFSRP